MEKIQTIITKSRKRNGPTSERAELLQWFLDQLGRTWDATRYGKLTPARLGAKIAHLKDLADLYYLKSCMTDMEHRMGAESAAKFFWWSIDPKKHEQI